MIFCSQMWSHQGLLTDVNPFSSEIADRLSTPSRNVTESMLLRWNSIEDSCDKLHPQYICVG